MTSPIIFINKYSSYFERHGIGTNLHWNKFHGIGARQSMLYDVRSGNDILPTVLQCITHYNHHFDDATVRVHI